MIQHKAMVVSLGLIALLAGCGGSSGSVTYTVGARVSGLSGSGLVLRLSTGGILAVTTNGNFIFAGSLASGASYQVTVGTQPSAPEQTCTVANGAGTISAGNVTAVVTCVTAVTILYSFTGGAANSSDGARPIGSLVQGGDGSLYGTTSLSGMTTGGTTPGGVAFKITLSGQETILQRYMLPTSALFLGSDGNFYGETQGSGIDAVVCLYKLSPVGAEAILATIAFPDGQDFRTITDMGGVIEGKAGEFYGIASLSSEEYGVFVDNPTLGLYSFVSGIGSGSPSTATLVQTTEGLLYGTAVGGGTYGMGTVFSVDPAAEIGQTIYSFGASPGDGSAPGVPLIQGSDGNLYGTTATGGAPSTTCPQGCGTVFKVTPAGAETVLYSFGSSPADGRGPSGALVLASDGNFYGTTASGGSTALSGMANSNCQNGCGTVYKITPSGIETVLYSFGSTPDDGVDPIGALLQASDGNLYGATLAGGPANAGTVFKLTLSAN
jgi:uncharacterized repeat protein (TIGR03803 family)